MLQMPHTKLPSKDVPTSEDVSTHEIDLTTSELTSLCVTILAGGLGKRMQSDLPKVLHKVGGIPMVVRLLLEVLKVKPSKILIVTGKFKNQIQTEIEEYVNDPRIIYVDQSVPLGTGHAVKCTLPYLPLGSNNIILNGDVPLLAAETILTIYNSFVKTNSKMMITAINLKDPSGNGRIIRDPLTEKFMAIVEEKDCDFEQKLVTLVNCGIYVCKSDILQEIIPQITNHNAQNEYYLTDMVKLLVDKNEDNLSIVDLHILSETKVLEISNVNTREQLCDLSKNFFNNLAEKSISIAICAE
jgi:UDP-N-acetylglucosamine diphosphorylase/glucosamine-1-phosphate N-acetyltransferase